MHITKNFFIIIVAILCFALPVNAKQYCHEPLVSNNGASTVYITCELFGMDNYQIHIESDTDINGFGGSFMHINGTVATDLRTALTISEDKKTATLSFTSTTAPVFYTPLYILMPGEVVFSWPADIEWGMCNNDATEYSLTIVQPTTGGTIAADKTSAKYGSLITLTATPAEGMQLDQWIVKDSQNTPISVKKNQFSMPASDVTITATFKQKVDITPAIFSGSETKEVAGTTCTFNWSITRTVDQQLTLFIQWDKEIVGAVPQVCIDNIFHTMIMQDRSAQFTTTNTYEDGSKPIIFFYIAYAGGLAQIDVDYTVGAENDKPSGIENIQSDQAPSAKVIIDGTLYIIRDGHAYNAQGQLVK